MNFLPTKKRLLKTLLNTGYITQEGSKTIFKDPQITFYPLLAAIFILLTLPLVNGIAFSIWDKLAPQTLFTVDEHLPHKLRIVLGMVTFSYFYTTLVSTYFICAVSASVMHKLDGEPTSLAHGLKEVRRHFGRVSHFAMLAIFFTPLAVIVQRRRLPGKFISVFGSALSLHTAQMAPAILHNKRSVSSTILNSVDTLGSLWKEGLIIKLFLWSWAVILTSVSFLPKLIENYWFDGNTAHWAGWLAATLLAVSFWVLTKVLGAVYVSTLYYHALQNKKYLTS